MYAIFCRSLFIRNVKENPQKYTNFNVFGHFSSVLKVFLGVTPVLQLFFTLNYYDIPFTHHSDPIALDSPYMTYLLRSQSARLRTFPL